MISVLSQFWFHADIDNISEALIISVVFVLIHSQSNQMLFCCRKTVQMYWVWLHCCTETTSPSSHGATCLFQSTTTKDIFLFYVVMCPTATTKAQCFAFHSLSVVRTATTRATFQVPWKDTIIRNIPMLSTSMLEQGRPLLNLWQSKASPAVQHIRCCLLLDIRCCLKLHE